MSKKKKAAVGAAKGGKAAVSAGSSVTDAVSAVKENPAVQRLVQDEDVRDNVRVAFESARQAYDRVSSSKKPPKDLLNDKKLHSDLQDAADALRDVSTALKAGPSKKRGGGLIKKVLLLTVGAGVALAASSDLRNKVLDLLFGAEEEFDYTSTTSPATPPPAA